MAAVTYEAHARAPLVTDSPVHTAGTAYSVDVKLQRYEVQIETPKTSHVTQSGRVETVLQRSVPVISATFIWPHSLHADVLEWLYSVAGGETFVLDPYGTVATEDAPVSVVCVDANYQIARLQPYGSAPWRGVTLALRTGI